MFAVPSVGENVAVVILQSVGVRSNHFGRRIGTFSRPDPCPPLPFLGRYLLALSFLRPAGLSQKIFEELAVLVEVFDKVGMVGARALHELVEVVRKALLGLLVRVISHGDQRGVGRSATIFFVLFAPPCGGALVLILALGLTFASAFVEALQEPHSLDTSGKGSWSRAIRARTPVVRPATVPGVCFTTPRDGPARVYVACHHCRSMDAIIMPGPTLVADDVASILVRPEPLAYRRSVRSGCQVKPRRRCGLLCCVRRL